VIAGAPTDHAVGSGGAAERRDLGECAPQLERAGALEVSAFSAIVVARPVGERARAQDRRFAHDARPVRAGTLDVGTADHRERAGSTRWIRLRRQLRPPRRSHQRALGQSSDGDRDTRRRITWEELGVDLVDLGDAAMSMR